MFVGLGGGGGGGLWVGGGGGGGGGYKQKFTVWYKWIHPENIVCGHILLAWALVKLIFIAIDNSLFYFFSLSRLLSFLGTGDGLTKWPLRGVITVVRSLQHAENGAFHVGARRKESGTGSHSRETIQFDGKADKGRWRKGRCHWRAQSEFQVSLAKMGKSLPASFLLFLLISMQPPTNDVLEYMCR